jgi:DNA invertase Pin-like site-specific DNA recombinase
MGWNVCLARDGAEGEQMAWTPEDIGDATRAVVVAIYCRLSQFGGKGLGRQEEDCRRIAAARGWVVGEVFAETASANPNSKKARKEWLRLLDAIQHHEFGAVVVWLEDRTNRNVVEAAEFVTLCRKAGVRVIIAGNETEYDFNDPEDVAKFYGESARAQAELARMRKRVTRAMRQIAEQGKWNGGGRRPFGYKKDRVTIDEDEAALLREAARRVLAGDSLRGICTDWNRRGIRTSTGQKWVNTVLRRTLISPRIAGFREHNGQLIPAVWPAILDQQNWEAVRAILTDPARVTWKGAPPSYLLTGLIHCGKCGNRMFGARRTHVSGHEYVIYLCHNRVAGGCVSRDVRYVDKEVTERLLYRLESTAFEQAASRPAEDPTRELYEQLAMEQGIYDRLEDKLARELISEDAFKRHRAESEERMNALRRKIAKLTDDRVITHIPRNLREVWPGLSLDRRRAILAAMIRRIEVHPQRKGPGFDPNTIKVSWKG